MSAKRRLSNSGVFVELFNLLINPTRGDFALRWHRDDVPHTATDEEERDLIDVNHYGVSRLHANYLQTVNTNT